MRIPAAPHRGAFTALLTAVVVLVPLLPGPQAVAGHAGQQVPRQLVVGFDPSTDAETRAATHREEGVRVLRSLEGLGADVVEVRSDDDPRARRRSYSLKAQVRYAEPVYLASPSSVFPDDTRFAEQYGLHNTGQTAGTVDADIDAPEAWTVTTGSTRTAVAVIDTGYDATHPDLAPNHLTRLHQASCPFRSSECSHGTHVAGIAGAAGDNGQGVAGVNWTTGLIDVPFDFTSTGAAQAIRMVADHASSSGLKTVINASWGGSDRCPSVVADALTYAQARGVLFVAAAGNDSRDNDRYENWPANCSNANVIAVAATDDDDRLAGFSNYGYLNVDLAAPGVSIRSTYPGGYASMSGTSMASPMVAGAAALVWAAAPTYSVTGLRSRLLGTVDVLGALQGKVATGGRLNVASAVGASSGSTSPTPTPTATPSPSPSQSPSPVTTWTRTEDNSSSLAYGGYWRTRSSSSTSGGTYTYGLSAGDEVSHTFRGTGVRWYGVAGPYAGIADVYLDGALVARVDQYDRSTRYGKLMFSRTGLVDGTHTLRIVVSGDRNNGSRSTYTYIDAIDHASGGTTTSPTPTPTPSPTATPTPAPTPTPSPTSSPPGSWVRYEEDSGSVRLDGRWRTRSESSASGGGYAYTRSAGDKVSLTFSGTAVRFHGATSRYGGIVELYVDGARRATIDLYSSSDRFDVLLAEVTGLSAGTHVVELLETDGLNPSARYGYGFFDAFSVS